MEKPLLLYGYIDNYSAEKYSLELFDIPDNQDSETWINSGGGSVFDGYAMLTALAVRKKKNPETKNNALITGDASSMAFNMLLFMDYVEAVEVANITIHRADTWVYSEEQQNWLNDKNKQLRKKLESKVDADLFKEVTGTTIDEIFDPENRINLTITAQQAKKLGIVQKIINLETSKKLESKYSNELAAFYNKNESKPLKTSEMAENKTPEFKLTAEERWSGKLSAERIAELQASNPTKKVEEHNNENIMELFDLQSKLFATQENELAALKKELTALKAELKGFNETLTAAKLTKSSPELPVAEFKQEENNLNSIPTRREIQAEIDARLKAERKELELKRTKL